VPDHRESLWQEFARAAPGFAERTRGRFDALDVPGFAQPSPGDRVLEVGCGTGNFLLLFHGDGRTLVGVDLSAEMLTEARRHDALLLVQGDGFRLPFSARAFDLATSAQALHHVHRPVPLLREMLRVTSDEGRIVIVDQLGPESYEQLAFMNELEILRDPSHATSRPLSAFRIVLAAAGVEIVDDRVHSERSRLSKWMWPGEFPEERIAAVRRFIERFGAETGMEFERDGDDWIFTRRRVLLLGRRPSR